jgi:hypothetical protein
MRPVSIVSFIAAEVVIGHVVPHLFAPHTRLPQPPATLQSTRSTLGIASPPLIAPDCRLQPPLAEADRRPVLVALRLRYPGLGAERRDLFRRFDNCGPDRLRTGPRFAGAVIR